jgi:Flp pilus assembly protein TadG
MAFAPSPRVRQLGQSLTEFALLLPILIGLVGATLDFARVYEQRVRLESATRDAAEWAATNATSSAEAQDQARRVVCLQFQQPASCTSPSVTIGGYSRSTTATGATSQFPLVTVTVSSTFSFQTILPYPFLSGADPSSVPLAASSSFAILQGR